MFRILGGILGFLIGTLFLGPLGMIIGPILGSAIGGAFSSSLFGSSNSSSNRKSTEDAYRNFYEQFYRQNTQRQSYSGYTNGQGNGYTGFQSPGVSDSCYQNLGCSRSDSKEDIKRKYRKLVSQYHPDRVSGRGLSSGEVDRAEAKFKVIQDSYDQIKKEKGI